MRSRGRLGCWPACMVEGRCDRWKEGAGKFHMRRLMTPQPGMLGDAACSFVVHQTGSASSGRRCLDPELEEYVLMTQWAWVNVLQALSLSRQHRVREMVEKEERVERQKSLPVEEGARQPKG